METYKTKIKKINKYFQEYLELIGSDHHKTCDGVWEIHFDYNGYDDNPNVSVWSVEHDGYINRFCSLGNDLEKQLDSFLKEVKKWIKVEKDKK